jgi:uncharacterized membrane protein YvbJ
MALIACNECGHKISDAAPLCPSCGVPSVRKAAAQANASLFVRGLALIVAVPMLLFSGLILVIILAAIFG